MYRLNEIPDYEGLLRYTLDKIPDTYDKKETSVIFNAVAPICMEISNLYLKLRTYTDLVFIDTSVGSYLDRLVLQNGITRLQATYTEKYATFNLQGLEGRTFLREGVRFTVVNMIENPSEGVYIYRLRAEEIGEVGNVTNGTLTSLNWIQGLTVAEITGTISQGSNVETDEHLRQRYIDTVTDIPYGGNQADYRQKIKQLDGVGQCKVIPVWNGAGTVLCIITNADYTAPTAQLVDEVQQIIDPTLDGHGIGIAPIGHIATIRGATMDSLAFTADITTFNPPGDLQAQMEASITNYLRNINFTWELNENLVVRASRIVDALLDVPGVIDVDNVTINGNASNYVVDSEKLPSLGTLVVGSL